MCFRLCCSPFVPHFLLIKFSLKTLIRSPLCCLFASMFFLVMHAFGPLIWASFAANNSYLIPFCWLFLYYLDCFSNATLSLCLFFRPLLLKILPILFFSLNFFSILGIALLMPFSLPNFSSLIIFLSQIHPIFVGLDSFSFLN